MKTVNRIKSTCLLLAVLMIFMSAGASADVLYDKIGNQEQAEEYTDKTYGYTGGKLLYAMGIIDEVKELDGKITRGEFCDIMAGLLMEANSSDTGALRRFSDINEATEYLHQISAVSSKGYMVGYETEFKPEQIITLNEAICVLVRTLGYEKWAQSMGGYFSGYDYAARELKFYEGFNGDRNALTRADVYVIVQNFLDAPVLSIEDNGFGGYTYKKNNETSFVNYMFKIYKYEGRITDNGETSLISEDVRAEGQATIGNDTYLIGKADISNLLGSYVKGYYKDTDDTKELLTAVEVENYSQSRVFDFDELESITAEKIVYKNNGRNRTIKISADADYVYNGMYSESMTKEMLDGVDFGDVRIVDYDNDGTYDLLIVNSYTSIIVETSSESSEKIGGKYNGDIYDLTKYESYKITRDGKEIGLSELHDFDVLLVRTNKKSFYAETVNKAVYGTVSSVYKDDKNREVYMIDSQEYKLSKSYINANINPGSTGNFYLSKGNHIVYFEADSKEDFGVLHMIFEDGADEIVFRIFTREGNWLDANAADRVKIGNSSYKKASIIPNGANLGLIDASGNTVRGVITYKINKLGMLTELQTPDNSKPDTDTLQPASDGSENLQWRDMDVFLQNPYLFKYYTKKCTYFQIPNDPNDKINYSTRTGFQGAHDSRYTITAYYTKYESKRFNSPDIVVQYKDGAKSEADGYRVDVVKNITKGLDKDGTPCDVLTVIHQAEEVQYCAKGGKQINNLKSGDVVKVWYNAQKELVGYKKVYNPSNGVSAANVIYNDNGTTKTEEESKEVIKELWGADIYTQNDTSYFVGDFKMADDLEKPTNRAFYNFYSNQYVYRDLYAGTVTGYKNEMLVIDSDYGDRLMFYTGGGDRLYRTRVVIASKTSNGYSVTPGVKSDICSSDKVFIRNHDGHACDVIIYR